MWASQNSILATLVSGNTHMTRLPKGACDNPPGPKRAPVTRPKRRRFLPHTPSDIGPRGTRLELRGRDGRRSGKIPTGGQAGGPPAPRAPDRVSPDPATASAHARATAAHARATAADARAATATARATAADASSAAAHARAAPAKARAQTRHA